MCIWYNKIYIRMYINIYFEMCLLQILILYYILKVKHNLRYVTKLETSTSFVVLLTLWSHEESQRYDKRTKIFLSLHIYSFQVQRQEKNIVVGKFLKSFKSWFTYTLYPVRKKMLKTWEWKRNKKALRPKFCWYLVLIQHSRRIAKQ